MRPFVIVTDSSADLPLEEVEKRRRVRMPIAITALESIAHHLAQREEHMSTKAPCGGWASDYARSRAKASSG